MTLAFKLVTVDSKYCDYLRTFDAKVAYNRNRKELRPFLGVLFSINNCEYFVPLSSPKVKHIHMHNTVDFIKLDSGKLGAINFNNMIPVTSNNYKEVNLDCEYDDLEDINYQILLKKQLKWLNSHQRLIENRAYNLYCKYISNNLALNIRNRCCNFSLLEEKCKEYNQKLLGV